MRYTFASVVLATVAVSQVAAGTIRHAHFHEKKHASTVEVGAFVLPRSRNAQYADVEHRPVKRDAEADLSDVDWSKVVYTYSAGQTWGSSTSAPVASAPTTAASSSTSGAAAAARAASGTLSAADVTKVTALGALIGDNDSSNNGKVWIGDDGPYVNTFVNDSGEDLVFAVWGPDGSWINKIKPYVTHSLAAGEKATLSFASGLSGAWSAFYPDTQMVNGQVANTWGEFTMSDQGVVDVSREVNMGGKTMSIDTGKGCVSDMSRCVFVCDAGNSCMTGYSLLNCDPSSQTGAKTGTYGGAASGGCGGMGSGTKLTTTFH